MRIVKLHCDYMENPVGFDFVKPYLGWVAEAEGHNRSQSAWQVQVARTKDFAETVYDSGRVESGESANIPLEMPLEPCTRYFWRVKIWDARGEASAFSEAAFFETARQDRPWEAQWIGGSEDFPQLRKGFTLYKPVKSARIYASGLGLYGLFCNGQPVSEEVLAPGFTEYGDWIAYQTYDVTALLREGENAMGVWLGNGYYKGRVNWKGMEERRHIYGDKLGFIAELEIEFEDGSRRVIVTDESWKATRSPFDRAEIYDGEVYDARRAQPGWHAPDFDDGGWEGASIVDIDKSLLRARKCQPMRVMETRKPVAGITTPKGEKVLDFGQNFAGWVRFRAHLPEGQELLLQFGEALDKDGNFYRENMRSALAEIRYISDGKAGEYAPSFTFFGFRYVKVTGLEAVDPADFTGEVVYSALPRTGRFFCSDERVNRLFENALWGQKSNFLDIPTDCPQRDERMGWTGDAQVFCATACMNMGADAFYRKYLHDLAIAQEKLGYVPVVVPNILAGSGAWTMTTTGWGDAATIIPWSLYLYYGDKQVLDTQYDSMKAWVEYMRGQDTLGVNRFYGHHLGDWLAQDTKDPDNLHGLTPPELIATAYYAWSSEILAKTAALLGREADAKEYARLAEAVREAFRAEFVSPNGRVVSETQTAQLIALQMHMVKPEQRPVVIEHLAERLRIDKYHLTTGFLGTPYLCTVLSENGLNEYAYELLLAEGYPGWLYTIEKGATTMWERWNSIREDGSMGDVSMNSFNHYAYGSVAEWMYRYAAGIQPLESAPGYRRVLFAPQPNSRLSHAEAEIETIHGRLRSAWRLTGEGIELEFEIPFNTQADIRLPDAAGAEILENGEPITGDVLARGSGVWKYAYRPTGETIGKKVPALPRY